MSHTVHVIGAGLLGTSVGLALRQAGWVVSLSDTDHAAQRLAADLGAGAAGRPSAEPDLVVVAVPPSAFAAVASEIADLYPEATVTDLSSIKSQLIPDVDRYGLAYRFVGGHPMAGRERSGPHGARADLFQGRPWVLCVSDLVEPTSVELVTQMVNTCGARPVRMTAWAHDEAVARVSHAPQVVASLLAAQLIDADQHQLELAGQGLRDTVRIAASDPDLWTEILAANATAVADVLERLAAEVHQVVGDLRGMTTNPQTDKSITREGDSGKDHLTGLRTALDRGRAGYRRIPGKHGAPAVAYTVIPVVIPDEPGALARLFGSAGEAGINIEDIAIEHSPGQPVGLVELSVAPAAAQHLTEALQALGWSVH